MSIVICFEYPIQDCLTISKPFVISPSIAISKHCSLTSERQIVPAPYFCLNRKFAPSRNNEWSPSFFGVNILKQQWWKIRNKALRLEYINWIIEYQFRMVQNSRQSIKTRNSWTVPIISTVESHNFCNRIPIMLLLR